jgi:hypothetical protein
MRRVIAPPPAGPVKPGPPPTFSVVIATYQAAGTIAETIESALAQTVAVHEVIVVDDGSTDATHSVLAPYLDRLIYVRQPNRGAAAASNVAFRRASGTFVAILDADDVFEPDRLEALTELAVSRPDLDILATDAYYESGGEVVGRYNQANPFPNTRQNLEMLARCFVAEPAIRRETILAAGGFDESLRTGYDWECWIRLLHGGSVAGLVDEPLLRYRIVGGSSLTDNRVYALRQRVRVLEAVAELDLSPEERGELQRLMPTARQRALLAEAELALIEQTADARRRALRVAMEPGLAPRARLNGLAAALAPRMAARQLRRREARTGETRIRRMPPEQREGSAG